MNKIITKTEKLPEIHSNMHSQRLLSKKSWKINITGSKLPQYDATIDSHMQNFYKRKHYLTQSKRDLTEKQLFPKAKTYSRSVRLSKPGFK